MNLDIVSTNSLIVAASLSFISAPISILPNSDVYFCAASTLRLLVLSGNM
uniref:Uncharacterized protein n=1 Tax=Siphoviridae sp. ctcMb1 TaxID=2827276 RepID=A0A8S5R4C2_9CAUD|nr:MAG TPA: hypothetical protein [Siphoviridae sp. ctcMb1]